MMKKILITVMALFSAIVIGMYSPPMASSAGDLSDYVQDLKKTASPTFRGLEAYGSEPKIRIGDNRSLSSPMWDNTYISRLEFWSYGTFEYGPKEIGSIRMVGHPDSVDSPRADMAFFTTPHVSDYVTPVERIRINYSGFLGVGTPHPDYKFQVAGTVLGTNSLFSLETYDGTYNPRIVLSHVTSEASQYLLFDSGYANAAVGYANFVFSNGSVLVGDTANANVTLGLTVNQGAADDEILSLKSSDVGHTVTTDTEADTYGLMKKTSATAGGLTIRGLTDSDAEGALTLEGIIGATDPTDTNAALVLVGSKQTGTTTAALGAAEEVLQIKNRTTDLVTVLGSGKVGIGTTGPAARLEVSNDADNATVNLLDLVNSAGTNVFSQSNGGVTTVYSLYSTGDVSALTFTDRTPHYSGDALAEIKKVQGKDGKIDHASLPAFAQAPKKKDIMEGRIVTKQRPKKNDNGQPILDAEGKPVMEDYEVTEKIKVGEEDIIERNLGAMISILTVAVQQLTERIEELEKKP